ncbi:hypothetical protein FIBSPDRAFT_866931 [Athelia psychrophila]|uniref:Cytochrome P450 n=1 Tax=Athelia psychrophila TaxID=1759441 RepID=A0A166EGD0_9AGAM|nr:hypothetical protein FIBSPDRAFT_866931 [Fibularhizoctonia sp. CBS 109695]
MQAMYCASESMPDRNIISEVMAHIVAGIDTTTISLSYLLGDERRPDTVAKLHAELDAAMPDPLSIPNITVLQNLPYLSAFIIEGFRLHGVVRSLLERVVPSPTSKTVSPASPSTTWAMHSRPAPSSPPGLAS